MSFDIDAASIQQYSTNIELLLQQKGSLLRNTVTNASYSGKAAKAVEQIGTVSASKIKTRHGDTPLNSTPHDARWVFPQDYIWADLIDDEDKLRMLIDPTSSYASNGAYALGRSIDDEIIAAFFSNARTGENGTSNISLPEQQFVSSKTKENSETSMSLDKLRAAKKILRSNQVDFDNDEIYCAITAQQEQDLLKETQITSTLYNTLPVLVDGKLDHYMGMKFIHIQRLPLSNAGIRSCPVWSKSGMHLGIWNEINVCVDKRPDKRNSTQVMVKGTFGATRTQEGKVINILCRE